MSSIKADNSTYNTMKSSPKINKHNMTAVEKISTSYEYRSPTRTNGRSSPNNFRHSPPTLTLSPKRSPRSPHQRIAISMLTSKNSNILSILGILILSSLFMNMYFWNDTYRGVVSVDRQKIDGAWEPIPIKVADRRFGKRMRLFQDKKNRISQSYSSKEGSQKEYQQRKDDIKQLKQMKRQEIKLRKQSTNTSEQGITWMQKNDTQQIEKTDGVQHQLRTFRFHPSRRRESHLPQLELSLPTSTTSIRHNQVVILDGISDMISKLDEGTANLEDWLVHISNGEDNDLDQESEDQEALAMRSSTAVWENDEQCVPMADWQTALHPTCNSLHEMDISSLLYDMTFSLVSNKGYWRSAWKIDESVILKSLKYTHEPNMEVFELSKVDAISLDMLTKSQFVINIHSFCGSSSIQEFAGGDLKGLLPKLEPLDKLRYATYMAEGLADIHSIASVDDDNSMASLIHNDINMDNVLLGYRNGKTMPIFNDFNIAIFPKKNAQTGEPCTFKGRFANPQWMSPEQLSVSDENHLTIGSLNEKIDVYALGNILFKVVCGNSPWKYDYQKDPKVLPKITEELKEKIVRAKLRGAKPKVPPDIRNTTDISIKAVVNAMNRCYRNDPVLRPSARDTYNYLKTELDAIERSVKRSGGGKSQ